MMKFHNINHCNILVICLFMAVVFITGSISFAGDLEMIRDTCKAQYESIVSGRFEAVVRNTKYFGQKQSTNTIKLYMVVDGDKIRSDREDMNYLLIQAP